MSSRSVLIVANEHYEDPLIQGLRCVDHDATELHGFFRHCGGYQQVELLRGAASEEVLDTIAATCGRMAAGDLFVFCFLGHGVEHEGRHLLLCPKARLNRLDYHQQVVPVELVKRETARPGLHRALILDACRTSLRVGRDAAGEGFKGEHRLRTLVEAPAATADGSLSILCHPWAARHDADPSTCLPTGRESATPPAAGTTFSLNVLV